MFLFEATWCKNVHFLTNLTKNALLEQHNGKIQILQQNESKMLIFEEALCKNLIFSTKLLKNALSEQHNAKTQIFQQNWSKCFFLKQHGTKKNQQSCSKYIFLFYMIPNSHLLIKTDEKTSFWNRIFTKNLTKYLT